MTRDPFLGTILKEISTSKLWVIVTFAIGAVSFYILLKKRKRQQAPPRRREDSYTTKINSSSVWNRIHQDLKGNGVCISWEVLTDNGEWREDGKRALETLATHMDVYLMCQIKSEEEKKKILLMVADINGLVRHKILFCQTGKGYEAFCRQIKPGLVILHDEPLASFLSTVLPDVVLVGGTSPKTTVTSLSTVRELLS
ncbi:uncharacterized protein TM35_000371880 [Trypanosoma theileri]|uniref:Peroxisome assembly protein 22 n=1 Tax=Trypanosoma theileri TaxID=67003 RepID=A0A1X0NKF5_9TRYP|nr:uncharacterized protein TM35_000371880 [Trypanosoma theileri]ORC85215.1 hypothetical protein TM35_000371880 [Trypanosoma theileri]